MDPEGKYTRLSSGLHMYMQTCMHTCKYLHTLHTYMHTYTHTKALLGLQKEKWIISSTLSDYKLKCTDVGCLYQRPDRVPLGDE